MFAGVAFLAVLTATIASHSSRPNAGEETSVIIDALARIEADVAALKTQLDVR
jgi:hypothetical protein